VISFFPIMYNSRVFQLFYVFSMLAVFFCKADPISPIPHGLTKSGGCTKILLSFERTLFLLLPILIGREFQMRFCKKFPVKALNL